MALHGNRSVDIHIDPGCSRPMDPDMAPAHSLDITIAPGGSISHPSLYGPVDSMTLGHQRESTWQARPWAFAQPSVATGTMDIDIDVGFRRAMNSDLALSSSLS